MSGILHLNAKNKNDAKDKKEKIGIFRNLFKGREDVFAKYWVSRRTGKKGYSPVCKNEWIPHICRKPCETCGNKEYVPLDDFWIEKHLRGDIIIGIYPIQLDDRVNFLTFDFDKGDWLKDSINLLKYCQNIDLPAYLERSKSGSVSPSEDPPQSLIRDASQSLQSPISDKRSLRITISNYISIPIKDTDRQFYQFLRKNLVIHNPIFYDKKAKGFSTWDTPRMIYCINSKGGNYIIPRGFLKNIKKYLLQNSTPFQIEDASIKTPNRAFKCKIKIHDYQKKALQEILKNNTGILEAPPGYGKTIIALATLVYRKQRTLVIVHTKELLAQWIQKIGDVLEIEKGDVGIIGGGKEKIGKKITVATYQSLIRKNLKILADKTGCVIVDECHRVPANTFQKVVKEFKARYLLGLTATPFRKDKLQKLMFFYMGEIIYRIDPDKISSEFRGANSILEIRYTDFYPTFEKVKKYKKIIGALVEDKNRNNVIVNDIICEYSLDKSILVLTGIKRHCLEISQRLGKKVKHSILTGNLSQKVRREILKDFKDKKIEC
jgi:hypothetical protein